MRIRTAVIGTGAMGRNHVRLYHDIPESELVAIADSDSTSGELVARRHGVRFYTDYREMLDTEKIQALSVCVPTTMHCQVATEVIQRGIHVLIEKPIAASVEEGQAIIDQAYQHSVVCMVGHIERFNPAVVELKRRLVAGELGRIFQIVARRKGPFPARVRDVGVVLDLAAHDLDVMWYLTNEEVTRVFAETARRVHQTQEDMLSGLLRFNDGTVGVLDINWLTPTKIRELSVVGERGMFQVDYLTQDLIFFENAAAGETWDALSILRGVGEGRMIRHVVTKKEPLRVELEVFLTKTRGEDAPIVNGSDGLRALQLAQMLVQSGLAHTPIVLNTQFPVPIKQTLVPQHSLVAT
jgi:UDP-N-acetylglucosamine 3-dehydrogenase